MEYWYFSSVTLRLKRQFMSTTNQIFVISIEKEIYPDPDEFFRGWRVPGSAILSVDMRSAFFIETEIQGVVHQNYGRFLSFTPGRHIEMAWMSRQSGGVETNICVYLSPNGGGSFVKIVHAGFEDEESQNWHQNAWDDLFADLQVPSVFKKR